MVCIWRHQKHDFANYYRFVLNFGMVYKTTKCVSVPNLKSFRPTKTEFQAKEVGEFSVMLYGKMGWGRSLAHQHGCCNINVWRFLKLWTAITFVFFWCIYLNIAEIFLNEVIYTGTNWGPYLQTDPRKSSLVIYELLLFIGRVLILLNFKIHIWSKSNEVLLVKMTCSN